MAYKKTDSSLYFSQGHQIRRWYNWNIQIINSIHMNTTTQLTPQQFIDLIPNQIPPSSQIIRLISISILKAACQLLLLYPINLIICLALLYCLASTIIDSYNRPKFIQYYPNSHIERHDHRIKAFKKDIRQIQNEAINLNRRMQQNRQNSQSTGVDQTNIDPQIIETTQTIRNLLGEREYIEQICSQFLEGIKQSQRKILDKLKKYRES